MTDFDKINEVYKNFNSKGLEIVSISLDKKKKDWINCIKNSKMKWHQMSNLKGWVCPAAKIYGVNLIPTSLLIDSTGVIVERSAKRDVIFSKIKELL